MVDGAPQPAKHPLGEMHMIGNRARERVLALDVRSGKCAFAVFEGPHRLLDFGSRSFARKYGPLKTTARKRFINLLNLYSPNLIVFRSASTGSNKTKARVNLIASTLRQIARGQSVRLRFISLRPFRTPTIPRSRTRPTGERSSPSPTWSGRRSCVPSISSRATSCWPRVCSVSERPLSIAS